MRALTLVLAVSAGLLAVPSGFAAGYQFLEGYNVLDTNNAPIFSGGAIGTNFAGTAGQERDIGVDSARGIIYIGHGLGSVPDGRGSSTAISAFVVTNEARPGSNFRDTGLIGPAAGQGTMTFNQSLVFDVGSDKLWVLGSPLGANPILWSAPGGTVGGAPNGDGISAVNAALTKAFQLDTNLLEVGVYVPGVAGLAGRGGQPRGLAVRTVHGTNTTVYVGMGNHVQAWINDQSPEVTNSIWRRLWATQRPPATSLTTTRVTTAFTGVNGLAVDDDGNCFFNVQGAGGRIWSVRPNLILGVADQMSLDFNDLAFGGGNEREIVSLIWPATPLLATPPQSITFARFDQQKSLFVSFLPAATQRGITRLDVEDAIAFTNGGAFLPARAINGFGSAQPAGGQDTILATMRLKAGVGVTQPYGSTSGLLYTDVGSVTNPTHIYVDAFVTDTNKGQTIPTAAIMKVLMAVDTNPPSITTQPASQTLLEGGTISLVVGAAGQQPLSYQWQSNTVEIAGATASSLHLVPASTNQSGLYRVVVSNLHGSVTSAVATVTVNPLVRSLAMTPLWSLAPGSRFYLANDNNQRGLAYNPNTENLLLVSRSPSNTIRALFSGDGGDLYSLKIDPAVITAGATFDINMVGASDDGKVYVGNLAQSVQNFRIYRWDSEDSETLPQLAYSGNPSAPVGNRWGDSFALRGSGGDNSLQIIAASRSSNVVAIFTTADAGNTLTPTLISVPGVANGAFGISVAFGAGNTFWGKGDSGTGLRLVQYDLANGTGVVLRTFTFGVYPASGTVVGVENSLNLLAGLSIENPDNLRIYNLADPDLGPFLVDQELFPADNANINATGAIDFGGGNVYALDSNNGIMAMTLGAIPPPPPGRITITRDDNSVTLTWNGLHTLQCSTNVTGVYTNVPGAVSGHTDNGGPGQKFYRLTD